MPAVDSLLLNRVLQLPTGQRTTLIEELIASLDPPDAALDERWLAEAQSRLAAYRAGQLEAIDADQVFADLDEIE